MEAAPRPQALASITSNSGSPGSLRHASEARTSEVTHDKHQLKELEEYATSPYVHSRIKSHKQKERLRNNRASFDLLIAAGRSPSLPRW